MRTAVCAPFSCFVAFPVPPHVVAFPAPLLLSLFPRPLLLCRFSLRPLMLSLFSCAPLFVLLLLFLAGEVFFFFLSVCVSFVGQQIFLRAFHHGCRRSAYSCIVFSATQRTSVNPKNYDENGDFCNFPLNPAFPFPSFLSLHAPPRNPAQCRVSCRFFRPNPTHLTHLIIKF